MEKLEILYGVQGNGFSFILSDKKAIKAMFPNAQLPKGIFVEYDMRSDFIHNHAQLEKHIFPALLGLPNEEDLKKFKTVDFIKMPEGIKTFTIEQNHNYEQEIQPLHRQVGTIGSYV